LRALRIAAPAQLKLETGQEVRGSWWDLPEPTQAEVLRQLSALIAKGVLGEKEGGDG
jgi:hypothetical protein